MIHKLAIALDDIQKAKLEAMAETQGRTTAELLTEAVSQYLDYDAWFVAEVEKGLEDRRAGRLIDGEVVIREFRAHMTGKRVEVAK